MPKIEQTFYLSIICPVHNTNPNLLIQAVNSIFSSNSEIVDKLIIVDDKSTKPETIECLQFIQQSNPRVTLIQNKSNIGAGASRNVGVTAAKSEWISFIDSDDVWLPNTIPTFKSCLEAAPDAQWISTKFAISRQNSIETHTDIIEKTLPGTQVAPNFYRFHGDPLTARLINGFYFHLGSCFIKREVFEKIHGFHKNNRIGEDILLYLRLSTQCPLYHASEVTYLLRRDEITLTSSLQNLQFSGIAFWVSALRDPLLHKFRRPIRWMLIVASRNLAARNMLSGRIWSALKYGAFCQLIDPLDWAITIDLLKCMIFCKNPDDSLKLLSKHLNVIT